MRRLFLLYALKTKEIWTKAVCSYDLSYNKHLHLPWKGQDHYASIEQATSHCGTAVLMSIHYPEITMEELVARMAWQINHQEHIHFQYFQPHSPEYAPAVLKLKRLGFKPMYDFRHQGYLNREPDFGHGTLWAYQFTSEDAAQLKNVAIPK